MRWEGVTPAQFDELRSLVSWETEQPEGAIFHVAWFRDGGITVMDVWESQEQFDRFMQDRLMQAATPPRSRRGGSSRGEPAVPPSNEARHDAAKDAACP